MLSSLAMILNQMWKLTCRMFISAVVSVWTVCLCPVTVAYNVAVRLQWKGLQGRYVCRLLQMLCTSALRKLSG